MLGRRKFSDRQRRLSEETTILGFLIVDQQSFDLGAHPWRVAGAGHLQKRFTLLGRKRNCFYENPVDYLLIVSWDFGHS
jgi:hypothetical protein